MSETRFSSKEHEKFYYQALKKSQNSALYHRAFFYCMGMVAMLTAGLLVGCGGGGSSDSEGQQSNEPLKLWVGLNQGDFYRELVKGFEEENDVTVEVVEVEDPNEDLLKDTEAAADVLQKDFLIRFRFRLMNLR